MSEYDTPVQGEVKTYTHKVYSCFDNETGSQILIRLSWNNDKMFIRSARVIDSEGNKHTPEIIISDCANERVPKDQLLGFEAEQ